MSSQLHAILAFGWALTLPAWALWPWCKEAGSTLGEQLRLSLALGLALLICGQFLLGLVGIGPSPASGCALLLAAWTSGMLWRRHRSAAGSGSASPPSIATSLWAEHKPRHHLEWLGLALLLAIFSANAWQLWDKDVLDVPGCGVWGSKARWMLEHQALPWELWHDVERPWLHRDYPIGWSLLLSWVQSWQPLPQDWRLIRLLPLCLALAALLELRTLLISFYPTPAQRGSVTATVAALGSLSSLFTITSSLYAEALLFFIILSAWRQWAIAWQAWQPQPRQQRALIFGGLLLGSAGWIKQEGLVLALCSLLVLALCLQRQGRFAWIKHGLLYWGLTCLGTWGPWVLMRNAMDLHSVDFGGEIHPEKAFNAGAWLGRSCLDCAGLGPLLWLAGAAGLWNLGQAWRDKTQALWRAGVLLVFAAQILVFSGIFAYSLRDLDWHLAALERVLCLPCLLFFVWSLLPAPNCPP